VELVNFIKLSTVETAIWPVTYPVGSTIGSYISPGPVKFNMWADVVPARVLIKR
jgi:hypothetical protein